MRAPAIVHLIGFPASGKLTVARALADLGSRRGCRFVVLDNHHTNNVIFAALDLDGVKPAPPAVWDRVGEVRNALLRTVEELSPREWSFVFTNVLTDDKPSERDLVDRLAGLAKRTDRTFLAVVLHCNADALVARVANSDRRARSKWIDSPAVRDYVHNHRLVDVTDLEPLTIDTAATSPTEAAQLILQRLETSGA
jgi:shikimate kinase